jgi:hypothetical protein
VSPSKIAEARLGASCAPGGLSVARAVLDREIMPQPPDQKPPSTATDPELQNEGEGSRSGARRYDAGAERLAKQPERVKELAEKAKKALEGPEGDELREADRRGKNDEHS